MNARLLLIEGDLALAGDIAATAAARGHLVTHATNGCAGLSLARNEVFDLAIIDRVLPEFDGLVLVETLRAEGVGTPVLFLSPFGDADDCVCCFEAGGDDYLTRPFAPDVLGARIDALLRRTRGRGETILRAGPLELDLIGRRAWRLSRAIELLPREFKLLEYIMRRPNRVIARDTLLIDLWGRHFPAQSNLVDVHMGKLRRKVDSVREPPLIFNVRNTGFIYRTPD